MIATKLVFFACLFMIFYIYSGYPVLVFLFSIIKNRKVKKGANEPHVTIIICAFNEEASIDKNLKNKLAIYYPKEKL